MPTILTFSDKTPQIGRDSFLADTAVVIGDVVIGARSSIWYGAVVRGDVHYIHIGDEVSVQDNTVIHVTSGQNPTHVGNRVTIGHSAVIHGCTIHDQCLIGMGAIVMDQAVIEKNSIVGAGALVTPGTKISEGYLAVGSPAREIRKLTKKEITGITSSAEHYVELATQYLAQKSEFEIK